MWCTDIVLCELASDNKTQYIQEGANSDPTMVLQENKKSTVIRKQPKLSRISNFCSQQTFFLGKKRERAQKSEEEANKIRKPQPTCHYGGVQIYVYRPT